MDLTGFLKFLQHNELIFLLMWFLYDGLFQDWCGRLYKIWDMKTAEQKCKNRKLWEKYNLSHYDKYLIGYWLGEELS
jgi:hypothetical protein